jgi:hypothetical protein
VRHGCAAAAIAVCSILVLAPAVYLLHGRLPEGLRDAFEMPAAVEPETWWILGGLIPVGLAGVIVAVRASLRWRVRTVAAVAIVAMLGVIFVDRHMFARAARTGDGEKMREFAWRVEDKVGGEAFAVARAERIATEVYLGRFGERVLRPEAVIEIVGAPCTDEAKADGLVQAQAQAAMRRFAEPELRWLVTCDRGLVELGAVEETSGGGIKVERPSGERFFRPRPALLGEVVVSSEPVVSQRWGRMYLIRLDREKLRRALDGGVWATAVWTAHASGKQEED